MVWNYYIARLKWTQIELDIKSTNLLHFKITFTHKEWLSKGKYLLKTTRENIKKVTCMLRRNAEKYGINSNRVYKWTFVEYNLKSRLFLVNCIKKNIQKHYYTILVQLVNSEILYKLFWNESTQINHNINTDIITFTWNICVWKNVSMCVNDWV